MPGRVSGQRGAAAAGARRKFIAAREREIGRCSGRLPVASRVTTFDCGCVFIDREYALVALNHNSHKSRYTLAQEGSLTHCHKSHNHTITQSYDHIRTMAHCHAALIDTRGRNWVTHLSVLSFRSTSPPAPGTWTWHMEGARS